MVRRRPVALVPWLGAIAWVAVLALSPWWVGFPLLLALAAIVVLLHPRLTHAHDRLLRLGLAWGLPAVLLALQRALGGQLFAWIVALLGLLAGYTLLAGLEAWLDRDTRRAGPARNADAVSPVADALEWPQRMQAPIGPPADIIELQAPAWRDGDDGIDDPYGGRVVHRDGAYLFDDGTRIEDAATQAVFSPASRWFAARLPNDRGIVLRDRDTGKVHRLRGWQLDGWHREHPWLIRDAGDMPQALRAVLGNDPIDDA